MAAWTFCLLIASGACLPLEGAPTYPTYDSCSDAMIPWMIDHADTIGEGSFDCTGVPWTKT